MAVIDLREYTEAVSLKRDLVFNEKYRITTANGRIRREIGGVYLNYTLELGNVNEEKYDELWQLLTQPQPFHTVIMPLNKNQVFSFEAIFDGVSDELITEDYNGNRHWDNLTINLVMSKPLEQI